MGLSFNNKSFKNLDILVTGNHNNIKIKKKVKLEDNYRSKSARNSPESVFAQPSSEFVKTL